MSSLRRAAWTETSPAHPSASNEASLLSQPRQPNPMQMPPAAKCSFRASKLLPVKVAFALNQLLVLRLLVFLPASGLSL